MYAVIFRATLSNPDEDYTRTATRLRELAFAQYGCEDFTSVCEGESEIAISYWASLEQIAAWREDPEHRAAQAAGKEKWYSDYSVEVVQVQRRYGSDA